MEISVEIFATRSLFYIEAQKHESQKNESKNKLLQKKELRESYRIKLKSHNKQATIKFVTFKGGEVGNSSLDIKKVFWYAILKFHEIISRRYYF